MYIVTNRNIQTKKPAAQRFGPKFNIKADDELRLAQATKSGNKWKVDLLAEAGKKRPSEQIFLKLQKTMHTKKRNCLFFVHGYLNSFKDVLERGYLLEQTYDVEVVAFTWPSADKVARYRKRQTRRNTISGSVGSML